MQLKIKNQEDFWAGVMFIGFGVLAIVVARDYPMGSAMRMGPGYFPTWLGAIMGVMGAIISARALVVIGEDIKPWGWRPLIGLSVAFAAFGLLMEEIGLGFVPALLALILISSFSGKDKFRLLELAILTIVLIVGSVLLFTKLLELPFRLFWWS